MFYMSLLCAVQILSYHFSSAIISSANIFDKILLNCIISMTQGCAVPWSGDFEKQIVCPVEQAVIVKLLYTFGVGGKTPLFSMYHQIACQLDPLLGWKWRNFLAFISIVLCKVNPEKFKNLNIPPNIYHCMLQENKITIFVEKT